MMSIRRRSIHLSLLALCASGGAAAADAPGDQGVPTPASDSGELTTITVTAQRRSEASQNVPIALQVVTSQQIEKLTATDLASMDGYVPGLAVGGEQPTQPNFTLRGISVSDFGIGTDSPIGIYEDGVYTGKTGGALLLFNDVQHIEVLKGPQGTLFGRNSAAGAISVVTNATHRRLGRGCEGALRQLRRAVLRSHGECAPGTGYGGARDLRRQSQRRLASR